MEGQNENDELYPIAVLIDELKVPRTLRSPSMAVEGIAWSKLTKCL